MGEYKLMPHIDGKKWNAMSELCLVVTEETLEGERDMKKN
jgi:hypothetical protein